MLSKISKIFLFCILSVPGLAQFKLYEKGHDSYTSGKYQDAITNFSQYLTKPTRDKSLDVEVYYLRALSYYKSNDFKNAIPDFEETILLDHANKGNIYWFLAKGYEKMGSS
jgi:tetratricopeptide (TPR) repeat protein